MVEYHSFQLNQINLNTLDAKNLKTKLNERVSEMKRWEGARERKREREQPAPDGREESRIVTEYTIQPF